MEIVFALLVLIGIIILAIRFGRADDGNRISNHSSPAQKEPLKPIRISSAGTPRKQTARFDVKSAEHLPAKKVIEGPAYVTDGDTIAINKTQVRLFGVDAPELNHPYGKKAKWALVKLCKGHKVRAEITDEDDYGRTVALCTLPDGRDLSAEMVKMGLAIDWPKFSGGVYQKMETPDARKKLWLAAARQKGHMHVWEKFEANQAAR
ncbi:MAG: thermonuclease family protein [Marinosulfonomonas sp.]